VLQSANYFYKNFNLKRVYYSGYVPVLADSRLPALNTAVPMVRENRLYQADWLMRFYGFKVNEIVKYPAAPRSGYRPKTKLGHPQYAGVSR
jgi:predicted DNA-binding helix-hairpin-helix protein